MGTTLTGTTPQDTYDSLIKVTDNGPLTGSLKKLTDGLGNDSSLSLSTAAARVTGNFTVKTTTERANITTDADLVTENGIGVVATSASFGQGYQYIRFMNSAGAYSGSVSHTASTGIGLYSGSDLILASNSTERVRVTSAGLTFNGDTAAANALDDYEEGTWTMGVSFGGAAVGVTYGNNTGRYTKIGRQVTVVGYLALTNKGSSTGNATITGLPFTIGAGNSNYCAASISNLANMTFADFPQLRGEIGTTNILFLETTNAGALTALTNSDFANNSEVIISFTYFV
jgi:hypothetical protein